MTMGQVNCLASLLVGVPAVLVAVVGWYAVHRFSASRDRWNRRHDMITQYLVEAYRRLELAAHRPNKTEEQDIAFESALADIQLLGSVGEIAIAVRFMEAYKAADGGAIDPLLRVLRDDLRKELRLPVVDRSPLIFRFGRDQAATQRVSTSPD
jgi:hypothetical protein